MEEKPRILCLCDSRASVERLLGLAGKAYDIVAVDNAIQALERLTREEFDGVYLTPDHVRDAFQIGKVLRDEQILEGMPDGMVLLDDENTILWGNGRLRQWSGRETVVGANFYAVLGSPEILGRDFCPLHTALAAGTPGTSTLRGKDGRFFQVHAAPVHETDGMPRYLIVTIRDVTEEMRQRQKLLAIHQAGMELADLEPAELAEMSVENRIEILKSNIIHFTKDLLNFDVVEIRLLSRDGITLEPLLSTGMEEEASRRILLAKPRDNGVTGFVAATGKSYLCEDTTQDPLYLSGCRDAKSSLTVPLIMHDQVIGVFNVESPQPGAFSESDLQFLEIFTRDVAVALNTLELLSAEKASTAAASVEAIHGAVALPVDEILNDAVNVMERYLGHDPEVADRLQRILRNARHIKQAIQNVGQKMAPVTTYPPQPETQKRRLEGRRILLVDDDNSVRSAAHALLERYGCVVETAPNCNQAMFMCRNSVYDVVIADIRLPDSTGHEFLLKLKQVVSAEPLPLVLMTGFGYDPSHSVVKARQAGLQVVLYKPFRLDQLLEAIEQILDAAPAVPS